MKRYKWAGKGEASLDLVKEPARSILAGIAVELLGIDDLLRVEYFQGTPPPIYGFRLKRRRIEVCRISLKDLRVSFSYQWKGQLIPSKPVPERPGWIYRGSRVDDCGHRDTEVDNPHKFQDWMRTVENHVVHRVKYLIEMQLKRNAKKLAEAEMRQNLRDVAAAYRQGVLGSVVNMGR
jgi:hypothetical protein